MEHGKDPTRNLALELARVTEAAALAAGRFMGRGDKEAADAAAVNAMRVVLQTVDRRLDGVQGRAARAQHRRARLGHRGHRLARGGLLLRPQHFQRCQSSAAKKRSLSIVSIASISLIWLATRGRKVFKAMVGLPL